MSLFQIDAGEEWQGGQRQSFFLAKQIRNKGFPFRLYVQPHSPLHKKAKEAGFPVFPLKTRSELDLTAVSRLAFAMKRRKCQLVHIHDAYSAAAGVAAASLAKVPLRVVSRGMDFPLKKNYLSRLKYTKDIDLIIAVSQGVKKVLIGGGIDSKKIKVIPAGIDYTPFEEAAGSDYLRRELSFSPDDFLVGMVAHLVDHKDYKYLIEATKILKGKAPKIKAIIVGEGSFCLELNKKIKATQVEDIVFCIGFREDSPQILGSLDLFVLSSKLDGVGSSIMDAMASRVPVVAVKVGGIPGFMVHERTGLLVPPKNPAALASAILRLYNDRSLAANLGEKGYEEVCAKFSADGMAGKIVREYERLAKKKGVNLF